MYCPDCGTQCDSKFCPGCGRNLQGMEAEKPAEKAIPPLSEPYFYEANGKRIDLHKVIRTYGTGWRKVGAYSYVMTQLGISKEKTKEILDPLYAVHAEEEISFTGSMEASFSIAAEKNREKQQAIINKRKARKQQIAELEKSGVAYCPKCLSTSVTATKRGFSVGQAYLGGDMFGMVGANEIKCVCLKCGHKWKP